MELINQPINGRVGERVVSFLNSQRFDKATFIVAFAREAGVKSLAPYLDAFRARGGRIEVTCGLDLDGTSYEGLRELLRRCDELSVFHAEGHQTFHPKMYFFTGQSDTSLIVGSSNLTQGGLWTNVESSLIADHHSAETFGEGPFLDATSYRGVLRSVTDSYRVLAHDEDIDALLSAGYIKKEGVLRREQRSQSRGPRAGERRRRLFGAGFSVAAPSLRTSETAIDEESNTSRGAQPRGTAELVAEKDGDIPIGSTFWIYMRSATSASGNQIDLSKKCRLEDGIDASGTPFEGSTMSYMIGVVEFFEVDPSDTKQKRNPILKYQGVDYYGSSILYPDSAGKGKRPNGSWRLQLNGKDEAGKTLTTAIKGDGGLVGKVVAFTKLARHSYLVNIYEESELPNLKNQSLLRGWNGSNKDKGQVHPPKPVGVIWDRYLQTPGESVSSESV